MGIEPLREVICKLGEKLGFEVEREVPASSSAWVDVVWFDKKFRFPKPTSKETLLRVPKLPVVGFEIESRTAINPKHVKRSITNLNDLVKIHISEKRPYFLFSTFNYKSF